MLNLFLSIAYNVPKVFKNNIVSLFCDKLFLKLFCTRISSVGICSRMSPVSFSKIIKLLLILEVNKKF